MTIPKLIVKRQQIWDIMVKLPDGVEKSALLERISIMTAIIKGQLPL